jgi:hypothetical protein
MYPVFVSAPPPSDIFIASTTYPIFDSEILEIIGHRKIINDQRIIMAFEESSLLHHGLKCSILSLQKHFYNDSTLNISISIQNHDEINYYIPDPVKIGQGRFNYLGSSFEITNEETQNKYWPICDYNYSLDDVTMNDLSMVERNNQVTFSFTYTYDSNIPEGIYSTYLTYGNLPYYNKLPLTQKNGRIWVGRIFSKIDTMEVY